MKKCRKCKVDLPLDSFNYDRLWKHQRASTCKDCKRSKQASYKRPRAKLRTTGEKELFKRIWSERPHVCETCWIYIAEANVINFDHIKTKGSRPDLRLDPANIRILCSLCHQKRHLWSNN